MPEEKSYYELKQAAAQGLADDRRKEQERQALISKYKEYAEKYGKHGADSNPNFSNIPEGDRIFALYGPGEYQAWLQKHHEEQQTNDSHATAAARQELHSLTSTPTRTPLTETASVQRHSSPKVRKPLLHTIQDVTNAAIGKVVSKLPQRTR